MPPPNDMDRSGARRARRGLRRTGTALTGGGTKGIGAVVTDAPADTTTRTSRREAGVEVVEV
ncbi:hypothetical protein [Actinacidiphila sp. bgisy167]|uniref:hypothetical protein n=1 Tax=Actinacidiphila sp. bgisy167 TaxID=3413797 RepID=UPI003D735A1B